MKIGRVLISKDWYYVGENWELPTWRPKWDKEFISELIRDKDVLCSPNTFKGLPKSIMNIANSFSYEDSDNWDINFWIWTFKSACDIFIIVHTTENLNKWSKFKMEYIEDMYDRIMYLNNISLYIKK